MAQLSWPDVVAQVVAVGIAVMLAVLLRWSRRE